MNKKESSPPPFGLLLIWIRIFQHPSSYGISTMTSESNTNSTMQSLQRSLSSTLDAAMGALAHTAGFGSRLIFGSDDKEPTVEEVQAAFCR